MVGGVPVDEAVSRAWTAVAHSARLSRRMLSTLGDPTSGSSFTQINVLYPHEKASDWCRSYLTAALEHLIIWADHVAPLVFHPDQHVEHTLRPAYTLARAAMEASAQAVWMTGGESAHECARRNLALIRWDYEEHRKSVAGAEGKAKITEMDTTLLQRASSVFSTADLDRPNHFTVLRAAAQIIGRDPEDVERIWRAASGAAHGKVWPSLALQHVVPLTEYEPGHFRTWRIPDDGAMTEVLELADAMTNWGVLRFADFCGADIAKLIDESRVWLASVIPLRDDADPDIVARLRQPRE
ncbi:MAG: hypothetical protein ACREXY_04705 [Gammaproteobacteria bacterium]